MCFAFDHAKRYTQRLSKTIDEYGSQLSMAHNIVSIILAGGRGERLWPVSRESFPKQFCKLFGEHSPLQQTALRANKIQNSSLIILTNEDHYFLCKNQLEEVGITHAKYLLEPSSRNTAPAMAMASFFVQENYDPDTAMLVLPADHYLAETDTLHQLCQQATDFLSNDQLILFGIQPDSPKTGYGYIKKGKALSATAYQVANFCEKPSQSVAQSYLQTGDHFWNSGMFLFSAKAFLAELKFHAPDIFKQALIAFNASEKKDTFFHFDKSFSACPSISIDYALMEKTAKAIIMPLSTSWSDLGCWSSIAQTETPDKHGNICRGKVVIEDSKNCLISAESRQVVAIGIENQVIVTTPDAVLVINKSHSQDVKKAVQQLKERNERVATKHNRTHRPWGYYETISKGPAFHVRELTIYPGGTLSLQKHQYRSEHWIVLAGTAHVTKNNEQFTLSVNQSTDIAPGDTHQLANHQDDILSIIEVQTGNYISETDIERISTTGTTEIKSHDHANS